LEEYRKVEEDNTNGRGDIQITDVGNNISCHCLFYRKWQLPYCHILKQHLIFGSILIEEYWDNWCYKWGKSRFKLYKGMTANYINKAIDIEIGTPICRRLNVREITEALIAYYYKLEAGTVDWLDE